MTASSSSTQEPRDIHARVFRWLCKWAPEHSMLRDDDAMAETARLACRDVRDRRGNAAAAMTAVAEWGSAAMAMVRVRSQRHAHITEPSAHRQSSPSNNRRPIMILDDCRHALRRLRANPGTALLVAGMLGLAIGITSAMFTVADHMLLRPVTFKDPSRLVTVSTGTDARHSSVFLQRDTVTALRSLNVFSAVSGFVQAPVVVEGVQGLASKGAGWVTPGTFEMLGVRPLMGRSFAAGEGRAGADTIAVLSETAWREDFNADPSIVGKTVRMSGQPVVIVGVMPEQFRFPYSSVRVWRAYDFDAPPAGVSPNSMVYARLADGVPEADALRVTTDAVKALPDGAKLQGAVFGKIGAFSLDPYTKTAIRALSAGVALVFLVLCANATNLILARTTLRRREFGVCSALGASRGRLMSQVFIENVMTGTAGLVIGLALAWALVKFAQSYLPDAFLLRTLNPLALDMRAAGASSLFALLAVIAAGLPPAWIGTSTSAADSMRLSSRGSSESRAARTWRTSLLIGEVALASSLLVGAGVLAASFVRLTSQNAGLDLRSVTTAWVSLPRFAFPDPTARAAYAANLEQQVRAMPGVSDVSMSFGLPPSGGSLSFGSVESDQGLKLPDNTVTISQDVTPGFFGVFGIKIVEGRNFQNDDTSGNVIVGQQMAAQLWPGQSPLNKRFTMSGWKEWMTVIGVAHEVRNPIDDPRSDPPEFYTKMSGPTRSELMLGFRCASNCPSEPQIRERIRSISAQVIITKIRSMEESYLEQFARPRAAASLAISFGVVSMLAAAAGLFSVLTYAVNRRRKEFGIRAAMGAQPAQLRALVFGQGFTIVTAGLALGGVFTWFLSRALDELSFGVSAASPMVWLVVMGVISVVTLLAAWRPSAHAMRANPVTLLRDE